MSVRPLLTGLVLALIAAEFPTHTIAQTLRVAVVQTVIEGGVEANRAKIVRFIEQAQAAGCDMAVFPENALYWPDIAGKVPKTDELDTAIERIRRAARETGVGTVFGTAYREADRGKFHNKAFVFGPDGALLTSYWKTREVPRPFDVKGVRCNVVICSDRWFLEHSDLPTLADGTQVIVDISTGHGGDDGRTADLRWIRYRPWAARCDAFVLVSNAVHATTDFMGHSPWGGGSAVIRPDGSVQDSRVHQKDEMIVAELDIAQATRHAAERRRKNLLLRRFWELGDTLLGGGSIPRARDIEPQRSAERDVKIAAAQIVCGSDLGENTNRIRQAIREAASEQADIVVFPELALTGNRPEDVAAAAQRELDEALHRISNEARKQRIYAIVGAPRNTDASRENCAYVIGDDGGVETCYAQIVTGEEGRFQPGESTHAMWFDLKGVHSIVTIGHDAEWVEIPDLAASRGMILHFHLTNETDRQGDDATLGTQRNLLALQYAQFGAVVNAADPADALGTELPARTGSLIVSREGGHNRPAPPGVECYLPYQTSIVRSAGRGSEMIYATRTTRATNNRDLNRGRNRSRRLRTQPGWHEWIKTGAWLINTDSIE